jgi:uncharacterized repeat protein (TIGR03803 family)
MSPKNRLLLRSYVSVFGFFVFMGALPKIVPTAHGQTLTTLYSFKGSPDGGIPVAGVVRDAFGNLYGTTIAGGSRHCYPGCGTVFMIDRNGQETLLHTFVYKDGAGAEGGLIADKSGTLYGTTQVNAGGENGYGWGNIFMLDLTGRFRIIHKFLGIPSDGGYPEGELVRDPLGNLYGATTLGGPFTECNFNGCGTIFKIDVTGNETILYNFTGGPDGGEPFGGVVADKGGNLYGSTYFGGMLNFGTVFKVDSYGNETVLHSFTGAPDGKSPTGGLVLDQGGNLYGTTSAGGTSDLGTVFKIDTFGNVTVLHNFTGDADGSSPYAGLLQNEAGDLYGTTQVKGIGGWGTVFKITASGKFKLLHSFNGIDGGSPRGRLTLDPAGNLYGTTGDGGTYGWGTVFKITR